MPDRQDHKPGGSPRVKAVVNYAASRRSFEGLRALRGDRRWRFAARPNSTSREKLGPARETVLCRRYSIGSMKGCHHQNAIRRHSMSTLFSDPTDKRLLDDIGLKREQALREVAKAFWQ